MEIQMLCPGFPVTLLGASAMMDNQYWNPCPVVDAKLLQRHQQWSSFAELDDVVPPSARHMVMHPSHVESKRHMHGSWILLFIGWMVTLCTMLSGRVGGMLPCQAHAASLSGGSSLEEICQA